MKIIKNPFRGEGIPATKLSQAPYPSIDADAVLKLLKLCPKAEETPLHNIGNLRIKDERTRMGLGAFKALGAAYVIAHMAQTRDISGLTFVTASAGNHGMSVAAGAQAFSAKSVIYLAKTVPPAFAKKLETYGARVVIEGEDYEASMRGASQAAADNGWVLLSDSSWSDYFEIPHRLMEGYLALMAEACAQMDAPPSHIFLQAGVGGLAGAAAAYARHIWGDAPIITVVEPDQAPALQASIEAGQSVDTFGGVSSMGRLDCKTPSLIALRGLSKDADYFLTLSDEAVEVELPKLAEIGLETTPSGGAGLAAFMALSPENLMTLNIDESSIIFAIISEGIT